MTIFYSWYVFQLEIGVICFRWRLRLLLQSFALQIFERINFFYVLLAKIYDSRWLFFSLPFFICQDFVSMT